MCAAVPHCCSAAACGKHLQAFVHGTVPAHEQQAVAAGQVCGGRQLGAVACSVRHTQRVLHPGRLQQRPHQLLVLLLGPGPATLPAFSIYLQARWAACCKCLLQKGHIATTGQSGNLTWEWSVMSAGHVKAHGRYRPGSLDHGKATGEYRPRTHVPGPLAGLRMICKARALFSEVKAVRERIAITNARASVMDRHRNLSDFRSLRILFAVFGSLKGQNHTRKESALSNCAPTMSAAGTCTLICCISLGHRQRVRRS